MRKIFVRFISLIVSMIVVLSVAGCGGEKVSNSSAKRNEKGFPEELSVFCSAGGHSQAFGITDPNEILSFKLLEEHTGTHVTWTGDPWSSEKFNLMIASGNMPDMVVFKWKTVPNGAKSYADDGVILPLKDLIEKNMPNLTAFLKENPSVAKEFTDDDGEIYYIPHIRKDRELSVFFGPQIRKDWLDKLGLEIPKTTDDLYTVLKAFKTQDPNGNGKNDEIPMGGSSALKGMDYLYGAFGTTNDFYIDGDKIKYGIMEDKFEEALKYLHKLFEEGLIDPDYLIDDRAKMDAKFVENKVGFVNSFQPSTYQDKMDDGERMVVGIPHLIGPFGDQKYFQSDYTKRTSAMCIAVTTACKDPEGALKWYDQFFGEPGVNYVNFGEEGTTYNWEDGYPKFTDSMLNNPEGITRREMFAKNILALEGPMPLLQDWRYYEQYINPWGVEAIKVWTESADVSGVLPELFFTQEELDENTQIMAQITTYADEKANSIIIGNEPIKNIESIRNKIKDLGIDKVIENYQAAYERYLKR